MVFHIGFWNNGTETVRRRRSNDAYRVEKILFEYYKQYCKYATLPLRYRRSEILCGYHRCVNTLSVRMGPISIFAR